MAHHIKTDGTTTRVTPADGVRFSLKELQTFVGGYIELVPYTDHLGADMLCNEEGRILELPHNPAASMLAQQDLYGDILALKREEWESADTEEED